MSQVNSLQGSLQDPAGKRGAGGVAGTPPSPPAQDRPPRQNATDSACVGICAIVKRYF